MHKMFGFTPPVALSETGSQPTAFQPKLPPAATANTIITKHVTDLLGYESDESSDEDIVEEVDEDAIERQPHPHAQQIPKLKWHKLDVPYCVQWESDQAERQKEMEDAFKAVQKVLV